MSPSPTQRLRCFVSLLSRPWQDPSFFVHRVGRTARAGRSGKSLTFLLEAEDPYVEFLRLKQVPLTPLEVPALEADAAGEALEAARKLALADREVLESGTRAFTSFVRAYKEHQCQFIFRFAKLDLNAMARSYALPRLPRMPELANHPIPVRFEDFDTDTRGVAFKDKVREAARQRRLQETAEEMKKRPRGGEEVEEGGLEELEAKRRQERREAQSKEEEERTRRRKRKGRHQQIVEEWCGSWLFVRRFRHIMNNVNLFSMSI